jgi:hypothetical protein
VHLLHLAYYLLADISTFIAGAAAPTGLVGIA